MDGWMDGWREGEREGWMDQINRLSEAIDVYSEWIDMCA